MKHRWCKECCVDIAGHHVEQLTTGEMFFFSLSVRLAEDFSDNEEMFAKDITKWSSNDLMDKIETIEVDEAQGGECFF